MHNLQRPTRAGRGRRQEDSDPLIRRSTLYALFEQAPAIIAVLRGPEHVFELVNAAYQQLFPGRTLIGRSVREALPEIEQQGFADLLDRVYQTGESHVAREARVMLDRDRDGIAEETFFNFIYQAMKSETGGPDSIVVFAFDVTDEVRARKEKDDFLAVVSHEMRTPLTSILGWTRMLRMGDLGAKMTEEAMDALERSAQAQVHLIEDLLDDTRITSGKLRLDMRPLEIRSIVESAIADVTPAADAKRVRLVTDVSCDRCPIYGDPTRLQQVILNLLSNAIKFTPEDGTVFVDVQRQDDRAVLSVRDTGAGIEPDLMQQLFQRFRQGGTSTDRRGGLGLGLSISRYLVEQHGGTISAASDGKGKGSVFTVSLPLSAGEAEGFRQREGNRAEDLPDLSGVQVLLIEDEADNRDVLATALRRSGAEVHCCASAEEAWPALQECKPAVIICDIALPGIDGCEFLRQLRPTVTTPALALTVFGSADEEARVRACGFHAFRQKPIEPADLAHEVARLAGITRRV